MAKDKFRVPASDLEELESIIAGYAQRESDVSNDDVAKVTGISKQKVGRNNRFLVETGILEGGNRKDVTSRGKRLGRAIQHNQDSETQSFWRKIIIENEFLSDVISTVRIRNGMNKDEIADHILYAADTSRNSYTERGSKTLVDIFLKSGLLVEEDGLLKVAKTTSSQGSASQDETRQSARPTDQEGSAGATVATKTQPGDRHSQVPHTININIQLQLPESEDSTVYDNLFKSLRTNLLNPTEEDE